MTCKENDPLSAEDSFQLDLDNMSIKELIIEAEGRKKEMDYETVAELLSVALEKKIQQLNGEIHAKDVELAEMYLSYGDVLLKLAERSTDIFHPTSEYNRNSPEQPIADVVQDLEDNKETVDSNYALLSSALNLVSKSDPSVKNLLNEDVDTNIQDEQLSWEVLECARICYSKLLDDFYNVKRQLPLQSESEGENVIKIVDSAAYVHTRLGDLLLMETLYSDAEQEYETALLILRKACVPSGFLIPAAVSLAQTQLYQCNLEGAMKNFNIALELIKKTLSTHNERNKLSQEQIKLFQASSEDIEAQLQEIQSNLKKDFYQRLHMQTNDNASSISKPETTTLLDLADVKTTSKKNPFDEHHEDFNNVVDLGRVQTKKSKRKNYTNEEIDSKKIKIDTIPQ